MTSKEYFEELQKYLNEEGFHILSEKWGDGYFVFDMGADSVCHFFIKEIPHWKFGIWFTISDEPEHKDQITGVTIFTRHTDDLDKFKPSRSFFMDQETFKVDWKDCYLCTTIDYIIGVIKLIKHYPILTYIVSYHSSWNCVNNHMLLNYIKIKLYAKKYLFKCWYYNTFKYNTTYLKLLIMKKYLSKFNDIKSITIKDNNDDCWIISPRYDMNINMNSEQCDCRIPGYVYYQVSGKRRSIPNADIYFTVGDETRGSHYITYREDYFATYGWKAKIFGRKKYINKIKKYSDETSEEK